MDDFGLDLGHELKEYSEAARSSGVDAIAAALSFRHNTRWANVFKAAPFAAAFTIPRFGPVAQIDYALKEFGLSYTSRLDRVATPVMPANGWPGNMRWGLDACALAARLVLAGQGIGAAVYLRGQLERWTANRAFALGIDRQQDEPWAAFISRIWTGVLRLSDPGKVYSGVSELLHGRGPLVEIATWETIDLAQGLPDTSGGVTMLLFADAISITVHQVRACALDEASNRGRTDLVEWLLSQPVMTHEPGKLRNTVGYVAPLSLIGLQMPQVKGVASYGRAYEHWLSSGSIGAGPSGPILAELAFAHRRFRSIRFAERAFRKEASTLGPDFSPQRLLAREVWYVYCAEIAGLEAAWSESDGARNAAAIASTAIRSAFLMWLEDEPRTAGVVRVLLEQTARLRTWRLKPARAAKLEERGAQTTPRDWLEAAGWRRLSALNRALGEFAHLVPDSRWSGAADLMNEIEGSQVWGKPAFATTTRGDTVNRAVGLLASELVEHLKLRDPELARVVRQLVLPPSVEDETNAWLDRVHDRRTRDFGETIFKPIKRRRRRARKA